MKSFLLCITLLICVAYSNGQVIKGRVYRYGTDSVITEASVYYSGSTTGTITNKEGSFELFAKQQQIPIIISCVGYYSNTVNYQLNQPLIIYLKPKSEELQTVTIHADGMSRKDEIQRFICEFIGTSAFAQNCTITNIDDINFFYTKKTQTLTANCDKPIIIQNKALGYVITYYLDKFENSPNHIIFEGNYIFKDDMPTVGQSEILRNRETAYKASRMRFIRALWHQALRRSGFYIYNMIQLPLDENNILVRDSLQQKYIHWKGKIYIKNHGTTTVTTTENYSFINKDGFYSTGLQWAGALSNQRIGDLLPFEYHSKTDIADFENDNLTTSLPKSKVKDSIQFKDSQQLFEKAYLHTDRDLYTQGDTVWFKAYLVNPQKNMLTGSSSNLYIDLISPKGHIVNSGIIRLENGLGHGDFLLADSLPKGKYQFRAYTNWMRNFGDNFIFKKEIDILNTDTPPANKFTANNALAKPVKTVSPALSNLNIGFYPEGGSLVETVTSIVGVKAQDNRGKGQKVSGFILLSTGDTVTNFTTDTLGMGLFTLLPVKGQTYHAVVNQSSFAIPAALSSGMTLQVKQTDTLIRVIVSNNGALPNNINILVKHGNGTFFNRRLKIDKQQTVVNIPVANIPEGVAQITLYDDQQRPHCERLVYIHHAGKTKIHLAIDSKTIAQNKEISIQINTGSKAHLSMSVIDAGLSRDAENIESYLMLSSELKGHIECSARYFDTTNIQRFKQLDVLLMTQGWRDFVWRRISDTSVKNSYEMEKGITLTGVIKNEIYNTAIPALNISLYAPGFNGTKLFSARTDTTGKFLFPGLVFYGKQQVKLSAINDKGQTKGKFYLEAIPGPLVEYRSIDSANTNQAMAATLIKRAAIAQALKRNTILKEVKITANKNGVLDTGEPYMSWGKPQRFDITAKVHQYKTLTTFGLDKFKGAVASPEGSPGFAFVVDGHKVGPRLVVNGSTFHIDYELYYNMPIEKFKTVELREIAQGRTVGYLLLLTLNENALIDNPGVLTTDITGYYNARTFYTAVYNPSNGIKPDYRPTIYWQPDITTDDTGKATLKFYNGSDITKMKIVVQGVTEQGNPVTLSMDYTVK